MADTDKNARVGSEIRRLRSIYRDIDKNKLKIVDGLIKTAAFMAVSLGELETTINADGYVSEYQNGQNQRGTKKTPEVETYLAMTKNYALVIRQLAELTPPERRKKTALEAMRDE